MIQAKGGEQIKGETLDDPQLTELGGDRRLARPRRAKHRPVLPRGPAILGITDINTRFGAPSRCPGGRRGLSGDDHRHRGRRAAAGYAAGVVMTRFLDQTILRREPRGLAPSRASTRVRRTWSARSPGLRPRAVGRPLAHPRGDRRRRARGHPDLRDGDDLRGHLRGLGQATTISGTPVSTPTTNPATAPTALTGDNLVTRASRELGVSPSRVRDGVEVTAPRAPGGAVGNQPTIATVTFTDESRDIARRGANLYAEAILEQARESSAEIVDTYEEAVARSSGRSTA